MKKFPVELFAAWEVCGPNDGEDFILVNPKREAMAENGNKRVVGVYRLDHCEELELKLQVKDIK